ncbi:type II toxin-antitoxin system prevent-host-death family antitoxin [Stenotrophomonas tumulicola]|uniref:Antitoxin n=1 Tax=Stenotrophomonas tumulicola TaxID=1685415 RepID=A0A7W3FKZ7_9GAMM|nr:type II toxin-antitoxin system prevent-host-death family antitoxin [Stenotrophomonas tumulicola]MBA8681433.1 type II toxin-antitoxin system Phd/YefM family antitoxin [Stenotrophomonas tumulicola]
MSITSLTSREFNQDTGRAKKSAEKGPVFITDRGRVAYVLLSIAEYRHLTEVRRKIADLLAMPEAGEVELEIPRSRDVPRIADLS